LDFGIEERSEEQGESNIFHPINDLYGMIFLGNDFSLPVS